MNHADKAAGPQRKARRHAAAGSESGQANRPERFAVTLDANTGEIIQIEGVDAAGARHELSKDEKARLSVLNGYVRLEDLLEDVFEAGIACVLGGGDEPTQAEEAKEDADLRRVLLKPLIEKSAAARLMRRDVLDRAIVQTLIHHSLTSRAENPDGGSPKAPGPNRAAPKAS